MCKLLYVAFAKQRPLLPIVIKLLIKFTGEKAKEKMSFAAKEETITKCFVIPINKKLALAKSMLNSKVDIVYKSLDENVVMNMIRNDA